MNTFLRFVEYQTKQILWKIFGFLAGKDVPLVPLPLDFSKISTVLVVRPDRLGDVVLSTPVYESLKLSFPHIKIIVLVDSRQAGILADNPAIHQILTMDRQRPWHTICQLRKRKYDLAITLNKQFSATATFFTLWSKAGMRAGYNHPQNSWAYNIQLPVEGPPSHEIENNLAILRHMGVPQITTQPKIYFTEEENKKVADIMDSGGRHPERPLILVKTGTRVAKWGWKWGKFQTVIEQMLKNADIWIINGPGEEIELKPLIAKMQFKPRLLPLISAKELALLMQQCDLLFCNHTGIMHLATAVEKPVCVIFKHGEIQRWGPRHPASRVLEERGQDSLSPETVIDTLKEILNNKTL